MQIIEYRINKNGEDWLSEHNIGQQRAVNLLRGTGIRLLPVSDNCPRVGTYVKVSPTKLLGFLRDMRVAYGKVLCKNSMDEDYICAAYADDEFKPNYALVFTDGTTLHIGQCYESFHRFELIDGKDVQIDAALSHFSQSVDASNRYLTDENDLQRDTTINVKFIFDKVVNAGTLTHELSMRVISDDHDGVDDQGAKYWISLTCEPIAVLDVPTQPVTQTDIRQVIKNGLLEYNLFGLTAYSKYCTQTGGILGYIDIPASMFARLDTSRLVADSYIELVSTIVGVDNMMHLCVSASNIQLEHMFSTLEKLAFQIVLLTLPPL